jgi:ubiquinone/menaquinone biosynthesis C-methylase UbiE
MTTRDEAKPLITTGAITDNNTNHHTLEALQAEYSAMASWYDSFWADYLNKTFVRPLQLVSLALAEKMRSTDDNQKETTTIVVVDVACGTGEFLKRLQQETPPPPSAGETNIVALVKYYGVEPCPEMLHQAQHKWWKTDASPHWIQSTAEALPLEDASADIICSTNAFHFFRNKPLALSQMHRILRGGGEGHRLVITDWCADYILVRSYHFWERIRWNLLGGYADTYPGPLRSQRLRQLMEEAGFRNVTVETYTVRFWTVIVWGMQTLTATK